MEFEPLAESKMDRVLSSPNSLAQESLAKKVAEALSEQIVSGRLSPGQRVDLSHYATLWNVSVTPLRDAAKHLESLGLIRVLARRGVFVADLGAKEVKDIFDVRIALETTAARLAATKIPADKAERALKLYCAARDTTSDTERKRLLPKVDLLIHRLAEQYCDNPRLQKLMEGLRDLVKWCQRTIILRLNEPYKATLPEHIAICEAVCARDPDRAAAAMNEHLTNTLARVQQFLTESEQEQSIQSRLAAGDLSTLSEQNTTKSTASSLRSAAKSKSN
jgi:DNA-binding GntR family transcriptional regulator